MLTKTPTKIFHCSRITCIACILALSYCASLISITSQNHSPFKISASEARAIGKKIWHNEAGDSQEKLTWWGVSENFASLGIGHFIWYPAGEPVTFTQTFPHLLLFMQKNGAQLPDWLTKNPLQPCPWKKREQFFADLHSPRLNELRTFLVQTIDLQVRFIVQRLENLFPALLATVEPAQQKHLKTQFYRIAKSPNGLYALIDYLNFKGEGTNKKEEYANQGWGLKHVLLSLHGTDTGPQAVREFAAVAKALLTTRVAHAPTERGEQRFLPGWKKRINTYTTPS
jgi:hypothetical protein